MRMRRFLLTSLVLASSISAAQTQFFPNHALDASTDGDQFKRQWYSSQLKGLHEPSLFEMAKTPSVESYRFLWLRTFHHPVAIRLELKPDGSGVLTTKVSSGAGGYRPGNLTEDSTRSLTKEEIQPFLTKLTALDFWQAPNPVKDQAGTDGSQWAIEGVKDGHYHVVDRWSPESGIARELGSMLAFDLARLKIPKDQLY